MKKIVITASILMAMPLFAVEESISTPPSKSHAHPSLEDIKVSWFEALDLVRNNGPLTPDSARNFVKNKLLPLVERSEKMLEERIQGDGEGDKQYTHLKDIKDKHMENVLHHFMTVRGPHILEATRSAFEKFNETHKLSEVIKALLQVSQEYSDKAKEKISQGKKMLKNTPEEKLEAADLETTAHSHSTEAYKQMVECVAFFKMLAKDYNGDTLLREKVGQ